MSEAKNQRDSVASDQRIVIRQLRDEIASFNGEIVFIRKVPDADKQRIVDDVADVYAVVESENASCGIIVYGYSARRKEWVANWSGRWVIAWLLNELGSCRLTEQLSHLGG